MLDNRTVAYLEKQKETDYKFKDIDKLELAHRLIEHIGIHDSHLRDDLVYPNLAHLLHDNHFNEQQLTDITNLLISQQYLHFDLENYIDDSVLIRSFTLLQLVMIVYVHNRDHIIESKLIKELLRLFLDYFEKEEDLRGFNQKVGWLHSVAHSADLFSQLMKVEEFKEREIKSMFKAITTKFKNKEHFFMYDEDERMVTAIVNGLERNILEKEYLIGWVTDFSNYKKVTNYPQAYFLTNNVKIFLRSLYFRLIDKKQYDYLCNHIKVCLKDNVKL